MALSDRARDQFVDYRLAEIAASSRNGYIRRQDGWARDYLHRQYMRELSDLELETRFEDVLVNVYALNEKGQITSRDWKRPNSFGRLFADILDEKRLRGEGLRGGQQFERYGALSKRYVGKQCIVPQQLWDRPYLFKVGRRDHLEDALNKGRLRICANTFFSNPALNAGMHDVEGMIEVIVTPSDQAWHLRSEGQKVPPGLETFRNTQHATSPYYMWCCSEVFRPEIAANFEGDACLVIKDSKRFARKFALAMRAELGFGTRAGIITYVDPLNAKLGRYDVPFAKHFRFAYQHEYRFVTMVTHGHRLEPIFIEIGAMSDYAELHTIHATESKAA
jgi:hypothetical protein